MGSSYQNGQTQGREPWDAVKTLLNVGRNASNPLRRGICLLNLNEQLHPEFRGLTPFAVPKDTVINPLISKIQQVP
jgi:hypothetical protein